MGIRLNVKLYISEKLLQSDEKVMGVIFPFYYDIKKNNSSSNW